MTLDRASGRVTVMASTEGGMDIEEVAAHTPEKILKETIDPAVGLQAFQARKLAYGLGVRTRSPARSSSSCCSWPPPTTSSTARSSRSTRC
jgi:succinyl-CoA synthetase beta subunit